MISKNWRGGENWVQYKLTISGNSGKLNATLIGDYLSHEDLKELEQERVDYFASKEAQAAAKAEKAKADAPEPESDAAPADTPAAATIKTTKINDDYVPIDFAAYTIPD